MSPLTSTPLRRRSTTGAQASDGIGTEPTHRRLSPPRREPGAVGPSGSARGAVHGLLLRVAAGSDGLSERHRPGARIRQLRPLRADPIGGSLTARDPWHVGLGDAHLRGGRLRLRVRRLLLFAVLFPAGVNVLVRTFALQVVLRDTGIINQLLLRVHLISEHLTLIRTEFAVALGMTCMLLPYMVLPVYSVMRGINPEYVQAAAGLGARPVVAFLRVFLPMSLPGLYAGGLIVFVAGLGFYVVPQLLGNNAGGRFLSQYTADYMAQAEWGYGSAIGTVLLLVTLTTLATAARVLKVGEILRRSFGGAR